MECNNKGCPLKEGVTPGGDRFLLQDDEVTPCTKCGQIYYCSQRCMQQDWFSNHQFTCAEAEFFIPYEEVMRIEESTPFIKDGILLEE